MKRLLTFILLVIIPMGLFAKETKEQKFWKWFEKNQATIYQFEKKQEAVFNKVSEQLAKYQEGLAFEISAETHGKREFIISADGIKELFPAVEALKSTAPLLQQWDIIKFRPRVNGYENLKLKHGGKVLNPANMWIYDRIEGNNFDLIIYHPEYSDEEKNAFINGTYILLDMALGEYDVVTGIRYLDHQKLPSNPEAEGLKPFSDLRKIFDDFKSKMPKPSFKRDS